ncbi:hypothetical protein WICPIJ_000824 [Wickerhamomyces pijperi]|uniref:PHD-type domain-containing protein n=1 Tax=Wickerhamomyces pijperi TaxID=599730 RepID=A0A9P8QF57_WICPI|nr:hypothetical protein WICPIJ_000824 [Wickerhamomyces pijperi]
MDINAPINPAAGQTTTAMDTEKSPIVPEPHVTSSITHSTTPKPKKPAKPRARKSTTPAVKSSSAQPVSVQGTPAPAESSAPFHTKFPKLIFPRPTEQYNLESEEIFCICRQPDAGGEPMVCCEGCEDWFHFRCVKIPAKFEPLFDVYFCPYCELEKKGVTLWRRKCAVEDCYKAIEHGKTKYCSKDHGLKHILGKLNKSESTNVESMTITALKYSKSLKSFQELGSELPKLPKSDIPTSITAKLQEDLEKLEKLRQEQVASRKVLIKAKENMKLLNEMIQETADTPSSSKKKPKKLELCGYDYSTFSSSTPIDPESMQSNDITSLKSQYDAYKQYMDSKDQEDSTPPQTTLCFLDKKKCLKHSGWQSIISDEIDLNMNDIQKKSEKIKETMEKRVKSYTIDHFESLK